MKAYEIFDIIEKEYPLLAACAWDNPGFIVGRKEKDVNKIYIALDATGDVIERAAEQGCDMILTHHPLLFSPLKSVTDDCFIGKRLIKMLQADMCCYASHTNYDALRMGKIAAQKLEILDPMPLDDDGIGVIGNITEPAALNELAARIVNEYKLPDIRIYGDNCKMIRKIAVVPGSGADLIDDALAQKADVILTGDVRHHAAIDAVEKGICVLDAGHYGLEYVFIEDMIGFLNEKLTGVELIADEIRWPYQLQ